MAPASSSCITCLENQPQNSYSVIYASFGSIAIMDKKERFLNCGVWSGQQQQATFLLLISHPNHMLFAPKMEKSRLRCRRLVLVPCPLQGHINPMLQLATILHSKGFSITVAHTQFSSPNTHNNHPDFVFQLLLSNDSSSSLELSDLDDFAVFLSNLNSSYRASLQELLTRIVEEEQKQQERFPCVIYDALMYSVEAIAHSLKLPSIILRTASATSWLAYFEYPRLLEEGCIPPQGSESMELVPGFHPLRFKDLPIYGFKNQDSLIRLIATLRNTGTSSAIIWNSMDFLEQSSLAQFQQQFQEVFLPIILAIVTVHWSTSHFFGNSDCRFLRCWN
ncbi:hypothetical protein QYF36_015042 [Acer negundo]|nr:hypothetical protein QYF36_015042 [Acer negundo]